MYKDQNKHDVVGEDEQGIASNYESSDFIWHIEKSPDGTAWPHDTVTLEVGEKMYHVGEYDLSCTQNTDVPVSYSETNELSRVQCWWGGAGEEISVFREGAGYVVKKRWIQESGGPEVNAPRNGEFEVIVTLD